MVSWIIPLFLGLGQLDPAWIALIATLFGGVGLKTVEHWLGKSRVRIDDATQIRDELRSENIALRAENKQLEDDVDKWRNDYYDMRDKLIRTETELQIERAKKE